MVAILSLKEFPVKFQSGRRRRHARNTAARSFSICGRGMNDERLNWLDRQYRDHASALIRAASAITRDGEAAQDIVQEAFVRAYRAWHSETHIAADARRWLERIVINLAIDHVRRGGLLHRRGGVLWRLGQDVEWTSGDPAGHLVERDRVAAAMGGLPPKERAALVLRHYFGYDYQSIASILGTTSGNVGSLINRGHSRLRRSLGPETLVDGALDPCRR